jgi:hypothetical protein
VSIDIREHHPLFSSAAALKAILFRAEHQSPYYFSYFSYYDQEEDEKRKLLMTVIPDCVQIRQMPELDPRVV